LPPLHTPTIGDRLTAAGVDWAWYSGGWSNANGDIGGPGWGNGDGPAGAGGQAIGGGRFPARAHARFPVHQQPFNYYAAFDPSTAAGLANRKAHLADEAVFLQLANASTKSCELKPVSLVKPIGAENEHPGYASESAGSTHLVDLIEAIQQSAC